MKTRHRAQALFLSVFVLVGLVAGPASSQTGCAAGDLQPIVADQMVNQGLPHSTLVRGKDAIVRLYLMMPACSAGTSQTIQVTGARLAATTSTGVSLGQDITAPLDALTSSPAPAVAPYDSDAARAKANASNTSPSNPRFALPETYLKPSAVTGAFTANLTVTVTFKYDTNGPSTTGGEGTGSKSFPIPAQVNAPSASLRILAVPMGDPVRPTPFAGGENLTAGMGTLGRVFPVPDGVGNVGTNPSATGGILWRQSGTMDLRSLMTTDGKFCGNGSNWQTVRSMLAARLEQQNSANDPSKTVDRVVGVIDTLSAIPSSGPGDCSDGYAGMNGKESWVMTPDNLKGEDVTGALLAMESAHNSGATTTLRQNLQDPTHAVRADADAGTNRAYDLAGNGYISKDKTALRSQDFDGWKDSTVLLESHDWQQVFCRLGGPLTTECLNPTPEGAVSSGSGSYATQSILVGVTDDTREDPNDTSETWNPNATGTQVFDSYFGPVPATNPPASSDYRFVQRGSGTPGPVLSDLPVAVTGVEEHHGGGTHTHQKFFSIAYPFRTDAVRWELWKGAVGSGTLLAARDKVGVPTVDTPMVIPVPGESRTIGFDNQTPLLAPVVAGADFNDEARVIADPTTSSLPNAVINVTAPVADAPLTITFDQPVFDVAMKVGNGLGGTTATLDALDANGDVLDTSVATDLGKPVVTPLSVASDRGDIASVRLTYSQPAGGPAPPEEIDDVAFTPGVGGGLVDVEATATTEGDPRHLRGAFFTQCPITGLSTPHSVKIPVAAALKPYKIEGKTGHFRFRWDSQNSCEDGGVATLTFRASDGYTISSFSNPVVESGTDSPPVAAILSPVIDAAILEHQQLSLSGQAYDSSDGVLPGSALSWYVSGPGFPETLVGTGNELDVAPPDGFSWSTGGYAVRLVATDSEGNRAQTSTTVEIQPDKDNDGISGLVEQCYAGSGDPQPDDNPFNAYKDADEDGLRNVNDDAPCAPADFYEMIGDFDPDTLFIPSSGNPVTFYVKGTRSLRDVDGLSVRLARIQGAAIQPTDPVFNGRALSWTVGADGVGVAKFDRQALTQWIDDHNLEGTYPLMVITGSGTSVFNGQSYTWTFEAADTTHAKPGK